MDGWRRERCERLWRLKSSRKLWITRLKRHLFFIEKRGKIRVLLSEDNEITFMAFENLDAKDKAICDALQGGMSDEQVMEEFDVTEEKLGQLRSVVAEAGEAVPADEEAPVEVPVETPADNNLIFGGAGGAGEPEVTPETEVAGETVAEANDEAVPAETAE